MNLHYANVVEVMAREGTLEGKVRVGGAIKKVSLDLVPDARSGDRVLLCDGVVISTVSEMDEETNKEKNHVPGNSR